MPEGSETAKSAIRLTLEAMLNNILKTLGVAAEKWVDRISQDVFNVKGHWDDSVFNLIKAMYRKVRGKKNYSALLRLIGFLTEPEHQEFGVISISELALTYKEEEPPAKGKASKPGEKEGGKKPLSVVEKNFAFFLNDFDFEKRENYTVLFESYDFLIRDFLQLEAKGRANRDEVVRLMHLNSLYADETLKKRLAGVMLHVADWPATLKKWRKQGWAMFVVGLKAADKHLNERFSERARASRESSANALAQAKERLCNRLQH